MNDIKKLDNHILLAEHYIQINKPDMAIKEAKSVLELEPDYIDAYIALSRANLKKENYESALDSINKALSFFPEAGLLYYYKATALAALNQHHEAMDSFETSISTDNSEAFFYSKYAEFLYTVDYIKYKNKINTLIDKAFEINPQNFAALNLQFIIQCNNHELQSAEKSIKKALTFYPNNSYFHNNYGVLLAKQGKQKEADKEFLKALQLDPNLSIAQKNLKIRNLGNNIICRFFIKFFNFYFQSKKHFVCGIVLPIFLLKLSKSIPLFREFSTLLMGYLFIVIGILLIHIVIVSLYRLIKKQWPD